MGRPYKPNEFRSRVQEFQTRTFPAMPEDRAKQRAGVIKTVVDCIPNERTRHLFWCWICRDDVAPMIEMRANDVPAWVINALAKAIEARKLDGVWTVSPHIADELKWCAWAAVDAWREENGLNPFPEIIHEAESLGGVVTELEVKP